MELQTEVESLPAWNNSTEYSALNAPDFTADVKKVEALIKEIGSLNQTWSSSEPSIATLQKTSALLNEAAVVAGNLRVFASSESALDAKNTEAQKTMSRLQKMMADLSSAQTPFELYLIRCEDSVLTEYLKSPETAPEAFYWSQARRKKDLLLSEKEEVLLTQFSQFGLMGWSDLYDQVSGTMKVNVPSRGDMGLAQASSCLRERDENVRREAWNGINEAWKKMEEPAAAILNNLAGHRLEEYRQRSTKRQIDFLEFPLMQAKIERATLDAMMGAIADRAEMVQRALGLVAKCFGKRQLDPWDLLAPAPAPSSMKGRDYTFKTAVDLVTSAFSSIDPKMGDFVGMMLDNGWVDARVLPNKRSGAFCTGFSKSRTPRVFQTFQGSFKETSTLAHELGHAWHSWVMRDLPWYQLEYPMTLAETASIFAETALADRVLETGNAADRFEACFAEVEHAVALLANIPARFEFEKSFYTARANGALTPDELSDLMDKAYRKFYGDALSQTERYFWMTKLHFSIGSVSFYNFPYTFGYLFSLGIYSRRATMGTSFAQTYIDILRDTGRMTAEQLIEKHLGADIRQKAFWNDSLNVVETKVAALEKLLAN